MRFQDVLRLLKIPFISEGNEHCRPGWLQLDCPDCSPGWKHYRMGYNLSSGYFNCWACGWKHPFNTLKALSGEKFSVISQLLEGVVKAPRDLTSRDYTGRELILPKHIKPLTKAHEDYLWSRGFDPNYIVKRWGVKGIGPVGDFKWRLFIPITYKFDMVSWTTRSISDHHSLRYRSAAANQETMNHKELLYGEDLCEHTIIIVEGPVDVWTVGPGAVATLGTGYSRAQVLKMSKYPVRVVCFDNEPVAQRRAKRLCSTLEVYPGTTYNVCLSGKDPNSTNAKEIKRLCKRFLG